MPTVSVTIVKSGTNDTLAPEKLHFDVDEMETIYDALEKQGEILPSGCLAGSCGTCRLNILSGSENLSDPSAVEKDTIEHLESEYEEKFGKDFLSGKHIRLSCRAKVKGPIEIELIKT